MFFFFLFYISFTDNFCVLILQQAHSVVYTMSNLQSRVVQLSQGERSYHIFYQLCAGAPSGLKGLHSTSEPFVSTTTLSFQEKPLSLECLQKCDWFCVINEFNHYHCFSNFGPCKDFPKQLTMRCEIFILNFYLLPLTKFHFPIPHLVDF